MGLTRRELQELFDYAVERVGWAREQGAHTGWQRHYRTGGLIDPIERPDGKLRWLDDPEHSPAGILFRELTLAEANT